MNKPGRVVRCYGLVALWLSLSSAAWAADHFLTIGGGYSPTGNQVSLEKNALFFQQFLSEQYPGGVPHDIYFSDGESPDRDLQFYDPAFEIPDSNLLMARLFRQEGDLGYQYRSHQVPGIRGGSTRENLDRWFQEVGSKLPAGDRLLIYVTGHGGKSNDPENTHIYLWNGDKLSVRDFVAQLDKISPEVSVVVVMVQCYAGGFANIIFQEGQSSKGLSAANRCGFFATVHDRTAAGCTPDIVEEDYKEYSSAFWAAMLGRTRTGDPLARPDFDGDQVVSFDEAHAFTLLSSDTIDISIKTSDAFLRAFSKNQPAGAPNIVTPDSPYETIVRLATPTQREVMEGLSAQLELTGTDRAQGARQLGQEIENERKRLASERSKLDRPFNRARNAIREAIKLRWPELSNRWDPQFARLLEDDGDAIIATAEAHPSYSEFARLYEEMNSLNEQRFQLERKWVKCQRLLRTIENVALAANLTETASPEIQARYQQLVAAEAGVLGVAAPNQATVSGTQGAQ